MRKTREELNFYMREYRKTHPEYVERTRKKRRDWEKQHPELVIERNKRYNAKARKENPERIRQWKREERQRNKTRHNSYQASYKKRKVKPIWVSHKDLQEIYSQAKNLGLEVDHIIPLTHPLVCGLHTPNNLQFLSRSENAKKSNLFTIED